MKMQMDELIGNEESPKNVDRTSSPRKSTGCFEKKSSFFRENDDQKLKRFIN